MKMKWQPDQMEASRVGDSTPRDENSGVVETDVVKLARVTARH